MKLSERRQVRDEYLSLCRKWQRLPPGYLKAQATIALAAAMGSEHIPEAWKTAKFIRSLSSTSEEQSI